MLTEADKKTIRKIAKKYSVRSVLLFGSSLSHNEKSHDIDIGVEGIPAKDFFSFYGDLMVELSKPVDIVDLSGTSKFVEMVKREGVLLYG
jgi:predicted nucleotidyltransferase